MDDLPVATLRPTGSGTPTPIAVYYVHADQLGTPRAITRPSDDAIVWKWDNTEPFGNSAANDNPSGLGTFAYNPRFPGQYYDAETGTNYNGARDYDPTIGRYIESDPIGLEAGLNTYAYVDSDPLNFTDPSGLIKPVPRARQRVRDCTNTEYTECEKMCAPRGVQSCKVSQTWRMIRYKDPPGITVWGWVDGPMSCSCNECEPDGWNLRRWFFRPKPYDPIDDLDPGRPGKPKPGPIPGPFPWPSPTPVPF